MRRVPRINSQTIFAKSLSAGWAARHKLLNTLRSNSLFVSAGLFGEGKSSEHASGAPFSTPDASCRSSVQHLAGVDELTNEKRSLLWIGSRDVPQHHAPFPRYAWVHNRRPCPCL